MDHLPRMYTPAECADVWRVKPDNVPAMCRRMGIGIYRLSPHAVRIDADDFDPGIPARLKRTPWPLARPWGERRTCA